MDTAPQTVTVEDMDKLVLELKEARADADAKDEIVKAANKKVRELEGRCVAYLKELKRDNYNTPDGTIYIQKKWTVQTPKTDDDKKSFFAWLEEKGIFWAYATVNSQSLNSLYKQEVEAATERGEMLSVPGIGAPTLYEGLGFRKGKG